MVCKNGAFAIAFSSDSYHNGYTYLTTRKLMYYVPIINNCRDND